MTVVAAAYMPRTREFFIVVGSRDCRLSVWKYDSIKKVIDEKRSENSETLFGHHNEITAIYIESNIGVVVSGDKVPSPPSITSRTVLSLSSASPLASFSRACTLQSIPTNM